MMLFWASRIYEWYEHKSSARSVPRFAGDDS
jgi:hypothetical protein